MTAPAAPSLGQALFELPAVQDALQYALQQLATWQAVPSRVGTDLATLQEFASGVTDPSVTAALTSYQQSLAGVSQAYNDSTGLMASVTSAAAVAQGGGTPTVTQVADAGRLVATMASGLSTLQAIEQDMVANGIPVQVGAGGGLSIPSWAGWIAVGVGAFLFYRKVLRKGRRRG